MHPAQNREAELLGRMDSPRGFENVPNKLGIRVGSAGIFGIFLDVDGWARNRNGGCYGNILVASPSIFDVRDLR